MIKKMYSNQFIMLVLLVLVSAGSVVGQSAQNKSKALYRLPGGSQFLRWEDSTRYHKTYYVDKHHPAASDQNPGTVKEPFRSINYAAQVAEPGALVMIRGGVYREQISPAHEGKGPGQMIRFQGYPGEEVVVKGSRIWEPEWTPSKAPNGHMLSPELWQAKLADSLFQTDPNPFLTPNATLHEVENMFWASDWKNKAPFTLGRGLIFQNGKRLVQMASYVDLLRLPGSFWIDSAEARIHVHPYKNMHPGESRFEVTFLQQLVRPPRQRMGYLAFENIRFEHAGNGFARVGTGAVFVRSGHHWIIENCTIRNVNSVALEIGARSQERPETTEEQEAWISNHPGGTIVRNNHIYQCGTGGIQGHTNKHTLLLNNHIHHIGWQHFEVYWECAAVKLLRADHTLIAGNRIHHVTDAAGIWIDWANRYSRISRNILYNMPETYNGVIFVEASIKPNMVDHNVIDNTGGKAINLGDTDHARVYHNLVMNSNIPVAAYVNTDRSMNGEKLTSENNIILNNVFFQNASMPRIDHQSNTCNRNLYDTEKADLENWKAKGWGKNSSIQAMEITSNNTHSSLTFRLDSPFPKLKPVEPVDYDFFYYQRNGDFAMPGPFNKNFYGKVGFKLYK